MAKMFKYWKLLIVILIFGIGFTAFNSGNNSSTRGRIFSRIEPSKVISELQKWPIQFLRRNNLWISQALPSFPPQWIMYMLPVRNTYDGAADREFSKAQKIAFEACGKVADLVEIHDNLEGGIISYYFKDPDPLDKCEPRTIYSRKKDSFSKTDLAMIARNAITLQDWKISGKEAISIALKGGGSDFIKKSGSRLSSLVLRQQEGGPAWMVTFMYNVGGFQVASSRMTVLISATDGTILRKNSYSHPRPNPDPRACDGTAKTDINLLTSISEQAAEYTNGQIRIVIPYSTLGISTSSTEPIINVDKTCDNNCIKHFKDSISSGNAELFNAVTGEQIQTVQSVTDTLGCVQNGQKTTTYLLLPDGKHLFEGSYYTIS